MNKTYKFLFLCLFFSSAVSASMVNFLLPLQHVAVYTPKFLIFPSVEYLFHMGRFLKKNTTIPCLTEALKHEIAEKLKVTEEVIAIVRDNTNNFLVGNSVHNTVDTLQGGLLDGIDSSMMHFLNLSGVRGEVGKAAVCQVKSHGADIPEGVSECLHVLVRDEGADCFNGSPLAASTSSQIASPSAGSGPVPEPFYAIAARHPFIIAGIGCAGIAVGYCMYKKINPLKYVYHNVVKHYPFKKQKICKKK